MLAGRADRDVQDDEAEHAGIQQLHDPRSQPGVALARAQVEARAEQPEIRKTRGEGGSELHENIDDGLLPSTRQLVSKQNTDGYRRVEVSAGDLGGVGLKWAPERTWGRAR